MKNICIITCCFVCSLIFLNHAGAAGNNKDSVAAENPVQYIYLTFDDGPLEGSEDIDDAVKQEKIKINVFVVGQHALSSKRMKGYYDLYTKNPFIEIGNHSYSHAHDRYQFFYNSPDSVVADFLKCQRLLNIPNKFARQPGRNQWRLTGLVKNDVSSGTKSADKLYQLGFKLFGWDVEWEHDPKTGTPIQTVDDMVELITKHLAEKKTVKPGHLVLLSHDEMFRNGWEESELKELIDKLKAKGNFQFEHLSKYPGL
ncbi:polysaccharide deacetylase family protein [Foetidibacter luteolus]|uniref:polysaccharide deacetylase family protein n=1 Tax=Foetidibacter luteolus TaxID=2608880 RepID=UPI00129B7B61|nr:polysaccharide deacetylase family protein [Foetidibacter luteolus]